MIKSLLMKAKKQDKKISDVYARYNNGTSKYYDSAILHDEDVCVTLTSNGLRYRFCDRSICTGEDFRNMQTFPQDYDFNGNNVQYVCGMSVPPNMMANIATEVWNQWLK